MAEADMTPQLEKLEQDTLESGQRLDTTMQELREARRKLRNRRSNGASEHPSERPSDEPPPEDGPSQH